jgi:hypothetical protein
MMYIACALGFDYVLLHLLQLRADIDDILKLSSFTQKPNSKAARRRRTNKKTEANAADAPAAFQAGQMPASRLRAISSKTDDLHLQHGMTWQSSTSQDGDESRGGMRTISSGSYGSRVNLGAEHESLFDRMTANNDLGRAILSRWTDPVPEPTLPLATTFSCPVDFAAIQPQREDDIFGDGILADVMPQIEETVPPPVQHYHEPTWNDQELHDIFLELDANGLLDCLNDTNITSEFGIPHGWTSDIMTQPQQPLIEEYQQAPDASFSNLNDIYESPNFMLDRSISFDSTLSLPLVTPSQSLESLLKEFQEQNYAQQLPISLNYNYQTSQPLPTGTAHESDWTIDTTFMPIDEIDKTTNNDYIQDSSLTKDVHEPQRPFSLEDLGIDWSAIVIPDITAVEGQQEADETYSLIDFLADQ